MGTFFDAYHMCMEGYTHIITIIYTCVYVWRNIHIVCITVCITLYCTVLYCRIQGNLGHSNHLGQVKTIWDKLVDVGTSVLCNIVLYCSVEYRAIWDIPTIWDKSRQFGTS